MRKTVAVILVKDRGVSSSVKMPFRVRQSRVDSDRPRALVEKTVRISQPLNVSIFFFYNPRKKEVQRRKNELKSRKAQVCCGHLTLLGPFVSNIDSWDIVIGSRRPAMHFSVVWLKEKYHKKPTTHCCSIVSHRPSSHPLPVFVSRPKNMCFQKLP